MATQTAPNGRGGDVVTYQRHDNDRLTLCESHTDNEILSRQSMTSVAHGNHWGVCDICSLGEDKAAALKLCDDTEAAIRERRDIPNEVPREVRDYYRSIVETR